MIWSRSPPSSTPWPPPPPSGPSCAGRPAAPDAVALPETPADPARRRVIADDAGARAARTPASVPGAVAPRRSRVCRKTRIRLGVKPALDTLENQGVVGLGEAVEAAPPPSQDREEAGEHERGGRRAAPRGARCGSRGARRNLCLYETGGRSAQTAF